MKKEEISIEENPCKFNFFVLCDEQDKCDCCGWNPDVAEQRRKDIRKKEKTTDE